MSTKFPFLTLSDAAKAVGLTPGRLRQMLSSGTLQGKKAGPRAWLIPDSEVKRLQRTPQVGGRPRVGKK